MARVSDQMRRAIRNSGLTEYRIALEGDIPQSAVSRFMRGKGGITLDTLDRIGDVLGFHLEVKGASQQVLDKRRRDRKRKQP